MGLALQANPIVAWYFKNKCPAIAAWVDEIMGRVVWPAAAETVRQAERAVLESIDDLLVYAVDPTPTTHRPSCAGTPSELTDLVPLRGNAVLDIGAGTGKLALLAAPLARVIYAVAPAGNLREYLRQKAQRSGLANVLVVDGLITSKPFEVSFADVTLGGHVFGDHPELEHAETARATRPGGWIVLCPGNQDDDNDRHDLLVNQGFRWASFEEPASGWVPKYWKRI